VDGSSNCLGFVFPGLFDVARTVLPVSARRGPTIAINLERIAGYSVEKVDDDVQELALAGMIGAEVSTVAIHEAAHSVELEDRLLGQFPISATAPIIQNRLAKSGKDEERRRTHGSGWIRGLAHFCHRATRLPAGDWWLEVFGSDVAGVFPGPWSDWLDALSLELASSSDEPIAEIVRRDPPPAFVRLFESRSAASAAH
jgi:hypothetical protein